VSRPDHCTICCTGDRHSPTAKPSELLTSSVALAPLNGCAPQEVTPRRPQAPTPSRFATRRSALLSGQIVAAKNICGVQPLRPRRGIVGQSQSPHSHTDSTPVHVEALPSWSFFSASLHPAPQSVSPPGTISRASKSLTRTHHRSDFPVATGKSASRSFGRRNSSRDMVRADVFPLEIVALTPRRYSASFVVTRSIRSANPDLSCAEAGGMFMSRRIPDRRGSRERISA
jgi:hypothetical protein